MNKGDYYIATQAIESVNKQVEHLNLNLKLTEIEYSHSNYMNDFNLELRYNDKLYNFDVEVKRNLINKTALLSFHELITNRENKILFVSDYISNEIKKYFRKHSISYISGSGNAFISQNELLLYFDFPKIEKEPESIGKAFEKAGIRLISQLLFNKELINMSYDEIAEIVDISKGSISNIFKDLQREGFLYTVDKKRILRNKKDLLEKWVTAYDRKLRPSILIGKYRQLDSSVSIQLTENSLWSGEKAAEIMHLNIKPQHKIIYTQLDSVHIIKKLKLIPDDMGNIELLNIFWNSAKLQNNDSTIVPAILVYADLILSKNDRNHEIAKELYEHSIQNNW